jgi:hypothetical protein
LNIAKFGAHFSPNCFLVYQYHIIDSLSVAVFLSVGEFTRHSHEILTEAVKFLTIITRDCDQNQFNNFYNAFNSSSFNLAEQVLNVVKNEEVESLVTDTSQFILEFFLACNCSQICNLSMCGWFETILHIIGITCNKDHILQATQCIFNAVKCYCCEVSSFQMMKALFVTPQFRSTITLMSKKKITHLIANEIQKVLIFEWKIVWWACINSTNV